MKKKTQTENSQALYEEGVRLLARRRFTDSLEIFEMALKEDRRNPRIYTFMGIAALYLDDLVEAERYFGRALQLDRDNPDALNGLSFVKLRTDKVTDATSLICDLLRVNPHNRFARKNFKALKNAENIEQYVARIHPSEFVSLPARFSIVEDKVLAQKLRIAAIAVIAVSLVAIVVSIGKKRRNFDIPWSVKKRNEKYTNPTYPTNVPLSGNLASRYKRALAQKPVKNLLVFDDRQLSQMLTQMRQLIDSGEFNECRFLYNKIMASNADDLSLSMAKNLRRFFRPPEAKRLKFNPVASDIMRQPSLYKSVAVKWFSRAVVVTNSSYIQVAPARFHSGVDSNFGVIVVGERFPRLYRGSRLELFGDIVGVDQATKQQKGVIFIKMRSIKKLN